MRAHRLLGSWLLLAIVTVAIGATTEELPGWRAKPEQSSLPMGVYVSAVALNFGQTVEMRADGTFESRFAGETHKKGKGARWAEFSFSGKWSINGGRIVFRYRDREADEERADAFSIGEWESKPAFMFSRPDDSRCAFVAEIFALEK